DRWRRPLRAGSARIESRLAGRRGVMLRRLREFHGVISRGAFVLTLQRQIASDNARFAGDLRALHASSSSSGRSGSALLRCAIGLRDLLARDLEVYAEHLLVVSGAR